jgi:hypothetical protein
MPVMAGIIGFTMCWFGDGEIPTGGMHITATAYDFGERTKFVIINIIGSRVNQDIEGLRN